MNEVWLEPYWQRLLVSLERGKLPHSLLLTGRKGIGKKLLADRITQRLLCQSPVNNEPCGSCKSCLLLSTDTHPDFYRIGPAEEGKKITVDQIREMTAQLSMTSQMNGRKVAIIEPAERMNTNAANSLLKTLEEPLPDTVLILISSAPGQLLPTIRSRCQTWVISAPKWDDAVAWVSDHTDLSGNSSQALALAAGSPFLAVEYLDDEIWELRSKKFSIFEKILQGQGDISQSAEYWLKDRNELSIQWLITWIMDMIRLKFTAQSQWLANKDMEPSLRNLSHNYSVDWLYQRLSDAQDVLYSQYANLNQQLALEAMFLKWMTR